jgi:hypothetical protein
MSFASEIIAGTLAPVPKGYWKLDDTSGTTAVDAMGLHNGAGNAGIDLNEPGSVAGAGGSMYFNGAGVEKITITGMSIPSSAFSVMAAVKMHSTPPTTFHNGITSLSQDATQRNLWVSRKFDDGNVAGYWDNTNTAWAMPAEVITLNAWHLMHLVVSGTNVKQYRDGTQKLSSTITAPADTYTTIYIAGTSASTHPMKGWMDNFVVWDSALTGAQVTALYNSWLTNGSNVSPVANAGADQTNKDAYSTITLDGSATDSDGTISSLIWTQISGSPSVSLSGGGADPCTFEAPGTLAGTTLGFRLTATDNGGATHSDDMTVQIREALDRVVISGVEVPYRLEVV